MDRPTSTYTDIITKEIVHYKQHPPVSDIDLVEDRTLFQGNETVDNIRTLK